MKGNWHFLPSFVVQVAESGISLEVGGGAGGRTDEAPFKIMKGSRQFLPSSVVQVIREDTDSGVRASAELGVGAGAIVGLGAGLGGSVEAKEPPLNPSHFTLQSTQAFGVP